MYPTVVPPEGGAELTLYGSGFARPPPPLSLLLNNASGPLPNHAGLHAVCRFGNRGGGGSMRTTPATVRLAS